MSKLQALLAHEQVAAYERFIVSTGAPLKGISVKGEKLLSGTLGNDEILALIKGAVPAALSAEFRWGNTINHIIGVGEKQYSMAVALSAEQRIDVEIIKGIVEQSSTEEEIAEVQADDDKEDAKPAQIPEDLENYETERWIEPEQGIQVKPLDRFEPEVVDALMEGNSIVYNPSQTSVTAITAYLDAENLAPKESENSGAVAQAFAYRQFYGAVLILDKDFIEDPVYQEVRNMLMQARRKQFTALVIPEVESGNPDIAYSLGVQLVMNPEELQDFKNHFEKAYQTWSRVVTAYAEILNQHGKI